MASAKVEETIYILSLKDSKYYIGRTQELNKRVKEHLENQNSPQWVFNHPVITIDGVPQVQSKKMISKYDELSTTLAYMEAYGIDNVRGSIFCYENLSDSDKSYIQKMIDSANNKCYDCSGEGHFSSKCSDNDDVSESSINSLSKECICEQGQERIRGFWKKHEGEKFCEVFQQTWGNYTMSKWLKPSTGIYKEGRDRFIDYMNTHLKHGCPR